MKRTITLDFGFKSLKEHPDFGLAVFLLRMLRQQGFESYLAGGAVRDGLLGRSPKDLDIATEAKPDEIARLCQHEGLKTLAVGLSFGVVVVVRGTQQMDVSSFREDGPTLDGRRPREIKFSNRQGDAQRRDFTINSMYYDPAQDQLVDDLGGIKDLEGKLIRFVGPPASRIEEDHLRILRAYRFASELGFEIDRESQEALRSRKQLLHKVSRERVREEWVRLVAGRDFPRIFLKLYEDQVLADLEPGGEERWLNSVCLSQEIFGRPETLFLHWRGIQSQIQNQKELGVFLVHSLLLWNLSVERDFEVSRSRVIASLRTYKLPRRTLAELEEAFWALKANGEYWDNHRGELYRRGQSLGFRWALEWKDLFLERAPEASKTLEFWMQTQGGQWPEPILRGEDIPANLLPQERKNFLTQAYELQLQQGIESKQGLLEALVGAS